MISIALTSIQIVLILDSYKRIIECHFVWKLVSKQLGYLVIGMHCPLESTSVNNDENKINSILKYSGLVDADSSLKFS